MIAGTFVRALPSWVLWLALGALVAASAGWGYTRGLSAERQARDDLIAAFTKFAAEVGAEGRQAQARAAAEITRQETINAQTHTAYGVALDRLRDMQRARSVRQPADSPACPGSSAVPADAPGAEAADGGPADAGSHPPGRAAYSPPERPLIDACTETTLQLIWLQHWVRGQTDPSGP